MSTDAGIDALIDKLQPAIVDSRQRRGHIALLLQLLGSTDAARRERQDRLKVLTDELVRCYIRISQIDDLMLPFADVESNQPLSIPDLANKICNLDGP